MVVVPKSDPAKATQLSSQHSLGSAARRLLFLQQADTNSLAFRKISLMGFFFHGFWVSACRQIKRKSARCAGECNKEVQPLSLACCPRIALLWGRVTAFPAKLLTSPVFVPQHSMEFSRSSCLDHRKGQITRSHYWRLRLCGSKLSWSLQCHKGKRAGWMKILHLLSERQERESNA